MVEPSVRRIGLDRQKDSIVAAEVEESETRDQVTRLYETSIADLPEALANAPDHMALAVSDKQILTKPLPAPIASHISIEDHCRFEMEQSLLDSPNEFCFDQYLSGDNSRLFGFAARCEYLDSAVTDCGFTPGQAASVRCRSRALALGLGYLHFCVHDSGQLVCLADVSADEASICLIHDGEIVALSSLNIGRENLSTFSGRQKVTIEMKTVVNFLIDSLMNSGITIPLSSLLVSGSGAGSELNKSLARYFQPDIAAPKINTGYLAHLSNIAHIEPERIIVALGATVR